MNVYYHLSDYVSHRKAGLAYMACLEMAGYGLTDDLAQADLVIIHDAPYRYEAIRRMLGGPGSVPCVGYGVWETSRLPQEYKEGLRFVDALWTCSEFSLAAFAPHHAHVALLPHVADRPRPARADLAWARERLGMDREQRDGHSPFYFYTITDTVNPRKDIESLLLAFRSAFAGLDCPVRLVVKQYRRSQGLDVIPGVIDVPEELSDGQIAALHACCNAYVSAHHAEAWGLPLSEALSFGNPVIATGYSGNMQFMTECNSFPVPYSMVPVSDRMCRALPFFTPDMVWAQISVPDLACCMRDVWAAAPSSLWRAEAAQSMKAFSSEAIAEKMVLLLQQFAA